MKSVVPIVNPESKPLNYSRTILLPTDFSNAAQNAYRYALHLAAVLDARIVLFHAYPEEPRLTEGFVAPHLTDLLQEGRVEEALQRFDAFSREADEGEIPVEIVLTPGGPAQAVLDHARELKPDFIVMGTQGLRSEISKVFGSVTADVLQYASCPVWVIPESARFEAMQHLMYATTLYEDDLSLMDELLRLAGIFGAKLSCTHIEPRSDKWYKFEFSLMDKILQSQRNWKELEFYNFTHPDTLQGLEDFIEKNDVNLIVMRTRNRGVFEHIFKPGLTKTMALYTRIPLLAYHG